MVKVSNFLPQQIDFINFFKDYIFIDTLHMVHIDWYHIVLAKVVVIGTCNWVYNLHSQLIHKLVNALKKKQNIKTPLSTLHR